ncbi:hypothetical protein DXC49_03925 [Bacteroides fragilis]|uniref:Uncharacterized protein n=1 Tax=Bacteroides fragilis TaxID=817 RepID=A0A5C6LEC7_BACFG|nr:hypothetical protein DXC49_03925 [Bacteroides fragilis]RHI21247.1 hypothetical protein DW176_05005 [Bacteroides fragilis]RHI32407.1 hypothetical protein DW170_07715 [Bacteroides fragilis]TWV76216.1 hypothetical protein FSA08_06655 [Bacteroides fragilis]
MVSYNTLHHTHLNNIRKYPIPLVNKTPIYVLPRKNICNRNNIYSYGAFLFYFLPSGTFKT